MIQTLSFKKILFAVVTFVTVAVVGVLGVVQSVRADVTITTVDGATAGDLVAGTTDADL